MTLRAAHTIKTEPGSSVIVRFLNGSYMHVFDGSQVGFYYPGSMIDD
jgi:hypothetical protein